MTTSSPRTLSALLAGYAVVNTVDDREIYGVAMDSRKVQAGDLFLACVGHQARQGHEYIADAIQSGAVAVAYEVTDAVAVPASTTKVPIYSIAKLGQQAGVIAERFYDFPSQNLFVIGITGTDRKSVV